ncbi:hypothetical protein [Citrobacter koseri]|uniref:hypothetical protein n=1 Tax=Citrobacter koseri TaxID=545 RepID=UPI003CFF8C89
MAGQLKDVVLHEVGHWLSWKLQGGVVGPIEIINYSLSGPKGSTTIIHDWKIHDVNDVITFTKSRIITLWSGVYAQAFDGIAYNVATVRREFNAGGGGRLDWLKAHEYLLLLKNLYGNSISFESLHHQVDQETATLIADNYSVVRKLSDALCLSVEEEDKKYTFQENELLSFIK